MKNIISCGYASVNLDFVIAASEKESPGILSYFDRSLQNIKAFSGMLSTSCDTIVVRDSMMHKFNLSYKDSYKTTIMPVALGKEKFYHAISINKKLIKQDENSYMLLFQEGKEGVIFYNYLMKNYELPLLKDWGTPLFEYFVTNGMIFSKKIIISNTNDFTSAISVKGKHVPLNCLYVASVCFDGNNLKNAVTELLQKKVICISEIPQKKLRFTDMDSYFKKYGPVLVRNLEKLIEPLTDLDGKAHDFTLKDMRLYPQQIATVNGVSSLLEKSKYAILNHGMGTGKTITAAAICESFFTKQWLKKNPDKEYIDSLDNGCIFYRNIVMCPGHLVEKWTKEIQSQIPYVKVVVITSLKQLIEIRNAGKKRTGKEFYILSKDFSKLSYQLEPIPKKRKRHQIFLKKCECGKTFVTPGKKCPFCGSSCHSLEGMGKKMEGMTCPFCNKILLEYKRQPAIDSLYEGDAEISVLDYDGFINRRDSNSKCFYCGEDLWQPHVANIGHSGKQQIWQRITHYANKAHKARKTVWVHRDYVQEYFDKIQEQPLNYVVSQGSRKYSPAEFIKRYMKDFFDIAIFDEAHLYKGGATGQGHAMHALVKSSKKQLALTGTIAGGYANHLFYLLWRLTPEKMKREGYTFYGELSFIKKYGKLETVYEYSSNGYDGVYKECCKGKQIREPKVKPGISPMIFMDFLLDHATFLDITDMSKYLPKLKEKVITVTPSKEEEKVLKEYNSVIRSLNRYFKDGTVGGMGVLSQMLQFSLSYADKPYAVSPIISTKAGVILSVPKNFSKYQDVSRFDNLLSKEKELVRLVREEISEGRYCFIFAEYTASPDTCISYRLKEILEIHAQLKGQVVVLESTSPKASEREAWMHKQAASGTKVFISNPRCVETGLDFCFSEQGVDYNYPTIIFYQTGYSLFTIWQASRRAYRLNQREECRTYYLALEGTIQPKVLELIAEKQAATSAIQGRFSTEGLSAMANGVDARTKIAQTLCTMDLKKKDGLQEMFDVIGAENDSDTDTYIDYEPMPLFSELKREKKSSEFFDEMVFNSGIRWEDTIDPYVEETVVVSRKRAGTKIVARQLSLFM